MRAQSNSQMTIGAPCSLSGRGYWTGKLNTLTFLPAPADSGIRFYRSDLPGSPSVRANTAFSSGLSLRTRLKHGWAEFDMVEHVLASLYAAGIDNVEVRCTTAEMPAFDGSSLRFTLALAAVGTLPLESPRNVLKIEKPIRVENSDGWITAEPSAADQLEVEYQLDYGQASPIGRGAYRAAISADSFATQIAAARTFISAADALTLQSQGLAQHVTHQDLLVFGDQGPVANRLRFPDECARHKTLDLVGDLALTGVDLLGRITAHKSGHQLNAEMARQLRQQYLQAVGKPLEHAA